MVSWPVKQERISCFTFFITNVANERHMDMVRLNMSIKIVQCCFARLCKVTFSALPSSREIFHHLTPYKSITCFILFPKHHTTSPAWRNYKSKSMKIYLFLWYLDLCSKRVLLFLHCLKQMTQRNETSTWLLSMCLYVLFKLSDIDFPWPWNGHSKQDQHVSNFLILDLTSWSFCSFWSPTKMDPTKIQRLE